MNDYKLLNKAYLDNTRQVEKYRENFGGMDFSGMNFSGLNLSNLNLTGSGLFSELSLMKIDPVLMSNKNRPAAPNDERGFIYLSDPNSSQTKCKYRVIKPDSSSTYSLEVQFIKSRLSDSVTQDIQNVFKELCIYPSSYRTFTTSSKNYKIPFEIGDTVKFRNPNKLNEILDGGIIREIVKDKKNVIRSYTITHLNKSYTSNPLDNIILTMINSNTCKTQRNISSENPNIAEYYYTYDRIPIERLMM